MALMCQGQVLFESIELAWLLDFREYFAAELERCATSPSKGLVTLDDAGIQVTPMGWYFVRAVAMVFDRYLQADRNRAKFSAHHLTVHRVMRPSGAPALLMGLAGGPHCIAMCGAACAGLARLGGGASATRSIVGLPGRAAGGLLAGRRRRRFRGAGLRLAHDEHSGPAPGVDLVPPRGAGLGADACRTGPAAPLGEQHGPQHLDTRAAIGAARGGVFATGALWAFMPCGLLYSALLVASLSGGPLEGALAMALFALGSGLSLALAPALYARLQQAGNQLKPGLGHARGRRAAGAGSALGAVDGPGASHRRVVRAGVART